NPTPVPHTSLTDRFQYLTGQGVNLAGAEGQIVEPKCQVHRQTTSMLSGSVHLIFLLLFDGLAELATSRAQMLHHLDRSVLTVRPVLVGGHRSLRRSSCTDGGHPPGTSGVLRKRFRQFADVVLDARCLVGGHSPVALLVQFKIV